MAEPRARHVRLLPGARHGPHFVPLVGLEAEGVEVVPRAAGAASEKEHGVAADDGRVRVPWGGGWHLTSGLNEAPFEVVEVELVEIIEMLGAIVAADNQHAVLVCHRRGPVARLGHGTLHGNDGPLPLRKVVPVEVAPVVAIVTRKDVHRPIVLHAAVAVPGCRGVSQSGVNNGPHLVLGVILPEVVHAVVPIVAGKDVDPLAVRDDDVPVPRRGTSAGDRNLRPLRGLETELVEVVHAVATVIAAKDVEVIAHNDASVQRALARRETRILHQRPLVDGRLALSVVHLHFGLGGCSPLHLAALGAAAVEPRQRRGDAGPKGPGVQTAGRQGGVTGPPQRARATGNGTVGRLGRGGQGVPPPQTAQRP
mmetsp:Transcript_30179/g.96343  ORF Transcript_30179/g.96343 Transcript_30179/m.96343 type:complete len:367 (+) Transcript_30179:823-1923(+)